MSPPTPRTPAGAYLRIRRGRRWSSVQVDRISITDATEQQTATVRELALAAACYCATHGRRGGLSLAGEVLWYLTVPTADLEDALAALLPVWRRMGIVAPDRAPAPVRQTPPGETGASGASGSTGAAEDDWEAAWTA